MRWTAVEFNFGSWLSGIMLSSGIKDARWLIGAVDPSSNASLFSINLTVDCEYWLSLHLFHLGILLLTYAPCPQLAYPYYLGEKC